MHGYLAIGGDTMNMFIANLLVVHLKYSGETQNSTRICRT